MQITLLQENFLRALTKTQRIIGSRTQLPILTHVLLTATGGVLTVTSTNLETTLEVSVPVKIEAEGSICIPAKLLLEFISSLPKDTVTLSVEKEVVTVKGRRSKATIPCVAATEFPPIPEIKENTGVDIKKDTLIDALSFVLFAAATDEARPLLTGIRIEDTPEGTVFVATDGYRLSLKTLIKERISDSTLVIPSRALTEVVKISAEEKEITTIRLSETIEGQLLFVVGDTRISTRRIDGEYPQYRRIIPTTKTTTAVLEVKELLAATKSASIFAKDSAGIIRFTVGEGEMTISANTPQVGENTVEIDATVEGDGGSIAVNSRFLLDLLNNFPGETITLEMTGALNPAVFKVTGDESFIHIIMPVRVQG